MRAAMARPSRKLRERRQMFKLIWLIREVNRLRRRCEALEGKLDHERERNREHEDQILSRFITLHGVVGVEAREASEPKTHPMRPAPHKQPNMETALKNLNPYQKSKLELYEEEGLALGMEIGQIHHDFYREEILGIPRVEEVAQ